MIRALAITGPTASGKTALSIGVAKALGCEIISLDSMQIYKGMDVGTAKVTPAEAMGIPHHMLDIISPNESFSAKAYRDMAMEIARDITSRGAIPLFVGGTGLYLSTLIRPECEEAPESDPEYKNAYSEAILTEEGRIAVWERLREVDPVSAEAVHYNNARRVIRALEIFDATGKPKSYFDALSQRDNPEISVKHIYLDFHNREALYNRVNTRVDEMLASGLISEVEGLLSVGLLGRESTAAQAIGYKEAIGAVTGEITLAEAADAIKQATRNYAKRQLTWFRNMKGAIPVFADGEDGTLRGRDELLSECLKIFSE